MYIMAVGGIKCLAHLLKELIENIQEIVRHLALAQYSGAAQVDEQHGYQSFTSLKPSPDPTVGGTSISGQERDHGDVCGRANLAGKPHAGRRTNSGQGTGLPS